MHVHIATRRWMERYRQFLTALGSARLLESRQKAAGLVVIMSGRSSH